MVVYFLEFWINSWSRTKTRAWQFHSITFATETTPGKLFVWKCYDLLINSNAWKHALMTYFICQYQDDPVQLLMVPSVTAGPLGQTVRLRTMKTRHSLRYDGRWTRLCGCGDARLVSVDSSPSHWPHQHIVTRRRLSEIQWFESIRDKIIIIDCIFVNYCGCKWSVDNN